MGNIILIRCFEITHLSDLPAPAALAMKQFIHLSMYTYNMYYIFKLFIILFNYTYFKLLFVFSTGTKTGLMNSTSNLKRTQLSLALAKATTGEVSFCNYGWWYSVYAYSLPCGHYLLSARSGSCWIIPAQQTLHLLWIPNNCTLETRSYLMVQRFTQCAFQ